VLSLCAAFLLLAGAASPASMGAPAGVATALAMAGVAAAGIRAHVPVVAVALLAAGCVPLFVARSQHAVAWERERARRAATAQCYEPGVYPERRAETVPGVLSAREVDAAGGNAGPRIAYLPRADAEPAAVAAAMREAFPPCAMGRAFDPTVVAPELVPSPPTPLAFHYVLIDDGDAPTLAAALEPALRDALVPRAGSKMCVQGRGAEPRFVIPPAPEGVALLRLCSGKECKSDEYVDLEDGHHAAFGSLELAAVEALEETPAEAAKDVDAARFHVPSGDGDRERSLRARWLGLAAFLPREGGPDAHACDDLRKAAEDVSAASTEARTLFWAGLGLGECLAHGTASADRAAPVRTLAVALLARVPAASGIWATRAAAARAAILPGADPVDAAAARASLQRAHALDAEDPLVRLEVLRGYACRARDATLVAELVTALRAGPATDRSWLAAAAASRAEPLATCAGAAGVTDAGTAQP
jgi:hypothetical protein